MARSGRSGKLAADMAGQRIDITKEMPELHWPVSLPNPRDVYISLTGRKGVTDGMATAVVVMMRPDLLHLLSAAAVVTTSSAAAALAAVP